MEINVWVLISRSWGRSRRRTLWVITQNAVWLLTLKHAYWMALHSKKESIAGFSLRSRVTFNLLPAAKPR